MTVMTPRETWSDKRLDDLNRKVDVGFARLDKKIDDGLARVDKKIDDGLARVDRKIDDGLARVDADIRELRTEMKELRAEMNARFDSMQRSQTMGFVAIVAALVGIGFF